MKPVPLHTEEVLSTASISLVETPIPTRSRLRVEGGWLYSTTAVSAHALHGVRLSTTSSFVPDAPEAKAPPASSVTGYAFRLWQDGLGVSAWQDRGRDFVRDDGVTLRLCIAFDVDNAIPRDEDGEHVAHRLEWRVSFPGLGATSTYPASLSVYDAMAAVDRAYPLPAVYGGLP